MNLEKFEEGDKILFDDRSTPLEVTEVKEDYLIVSGPKGGKYEIYKDGETLLVSQKDKRKYSSYCKNLRKVGSWNREKDKRWIHSKSNAKIKLIKNKSGFWEIKTENISIEVDNPKYGFSSKEHAIEEVEKVLEQNPEGKT